MPNGLVAITPTSSVSYSNIFKNLTTFLASTHCWAHNSARGWHSVLAAVTAFCSTRHSNMYPLSPPHTHSGWVVYVCVIPQVRQTCVFTTNFKNTFHLNFVFLVYTHTSGNSLKSGRRFWSFQWKPITLERQYLLRSQSWCGSRNMSLTR